MRLTAGARVGPYEVLASLGAGGMGEVYRARDTRLGREVALKVIADGAALDPERLKRFEQEARLAGSLNHPNLVVVFDVGSEGGAPFLVTELLEGESLRHRLSRGRLSLRTALELGVQIAEGLAAAHARGVVHRDVKPENVFLTSGGRAKLLDFGIAKLTAPRAIEGTRNLLDTTLTPEGVGTRPGAVLGTPGYMSPEQVRGDPVDARTDIFSLGTVLYEMLAGAPAFPAKSFIESGHAILESEPPPLPDSVPPSVDLLVRRCLEKEPARRFQSAADLAFDLGAATAPSSGRGRSIAPRGARSLLARLAQLGAVLALVAAVAIVTRSISRRLDAPEFPKFERITFHEGGIGPARFTPEGRVVFSAAFEGRPEQVYAHASGTPELQPLGLPPARLAAVSPKTGELAVLMGSGRYELVLPTGTLARVPAVGGVPRELAEDVAWAEWTGSGELAVARKRGGLTWIERPLGNKVWEGLNHIHDLRCSPDGEQLAFVHHPGDAGSRIIVLDRHNTPHLLLTTSPGEFVYSLAWRPDGQHLRFPTTGPWGTKLSDVSLEGQVRPLYQVPGTALLQDIAPDGRMLFSLVEQRRHIAMMRPGEATRRELTWLSNPVIADLSADGRKLLFQDADLWGISTVWQTHAVLGATDGTPPKDLGPGIPLALSPDGRTMAMTPRGGGRLLLVPTGAGRTEEVPLSGLLVGIGQWSRDGQRLWIAARQNDRAQFRLFPVDVATRRLLEPIAGSDVDADADFNAVLISPDDRWLAASGPDRVVTVYSLSKGEPIRLSSLQTDPRPFPAGWTSSGALWVGLPGATPRLVKLELPTGKIIRSVDIDLHEVDGDMEGARIVPDESVIAVQYSVWRGRLELMTGIPADR